VTAHPIALAVVLLVGLVMITIWTLRFTVWLFLLPFRVVLGPRYRYW